MKDLFLVFMFVFIILRLEYNVFIDLNYILVVLVGSCFYWFEGKEYWIDEGCKVGIVVEMMSIKNI